MVVKRILGEILSPRLRHAGMIRQILNTNNSTVRKDSQGGHLTVEIQDKFE
jgi:hypothetical protein